MYELWKLLGEERRGVRYVCVSTYIICVCKSVCVMEINHCNNYSANLDGIKNNVCGLYFNHNCSERNTSLRLLPNDLSYAPTRSFISTNSTDPLKLICRCRCISQLTRYTWVK